MKSGDQFDMTDYELVARIETLSGDTEVFVMHNASTHYLVATRTYDEGATAPGTFVTAFPYWADDPTPVYRAALACALRIVMEQPAPLRIRL